MLRFSRLSAVARASANALRNSSATAAKPVAPAMSETERLITQEYKHGAHNYHPIPVVLSKGKGVHVWDVEGQHYYDFMGAYAAVNQGHCHPKIIATLMKQVGPCRCFPLS